MRKKDCFYVGKIVRKHSFKGEVVAKLDTDEPELYQNLESVLLEFSNQLIPFFIKKSLLQKGNQLRILFEDIDSEEDADSIINVELYLPLTMLPKLSGNKFYYHEVIGFSVFDSRHKTIGTIKKINDQSAQPLFVINADDKEILIPMIDEFIKKVDRKNKQIIIETPPGLIDLYLE